MNTTTKTDQDILRERTDAILNSILSLNNNCLNLAALLQNPEEFKRLARPLVQPTVETCMSESATLYSDAWRLSQSNTAMRFALEMIVANMAIPDGPIKAALRAALPSHPSLA